MAITKVGVLGCGLMGSGIAQVCAAAGYSTRVAEISEDRLKQGLERIFGALDRLVEKSRLEIPRRDEIRGRLEGTCRLADMEACDLIVEAVTEEAAAKRELFAALDSICQKPVILASNTSSLSITDLASATRREDRFVGLHFFNPVPVMPLVEVVDTLSTDPQVLEEVTRFAVTLGKEPVRCRDRSGFMVNRLLIPYLLDAIRLYEEGGGSLQDLDRAMKLGCGHPMGPFQLLDLIGLDTVCQIAEAMFDEYRETRFAPPPLLKRMVRTRRLGRKSGRGFYPYDDRLSES